MIGPEAGLELAQTRRTPERTGTTFSALGNAARIVLDASSLAVRTRPSNAE